MRVSQISLVGQSIFYIAAGVNHFWHLPFYVHIMPDHYADPGAWVQLTGVAEILGGAGLLLPATRRAAALSIAAMLIGYFDVHIFMLRHAERFPEVAKWALWARIPLQFILIAWALKHAGGDPSTRGGVA
jgi:uncharacterized membrane protein